MNADITSSSDSSDEVGSHFAYCCNLTNFNSFYASIVHPTMAEGGVWEGGHSSFSAVHITYHSIPWRFCCHLHVSMECARVMRANVVLIPLALHSVQCGYILCFYSAHTHTQIYTCRHSGSTLILFLWHYMHFVSSSTRACCFAVMFSSYALFLFSISM